MFTTVFTPRDNWHPVSGHRQFGYVPLRGDTAVFYTRGVDRVTRAFSWIPGARRGGFLAADIAWGSWAIRVLKDVIARGGDAQLVGRRVVGNRTSVSWQAVETEFRGTAGATADGGCPAAPAIAVDR